METDGEGGGGGGEAERRGSELGRLLETIGSSEVLEKRIPLIKQLEEEFSADHIGLILKALLASWVDSTCSGVSHCTLHRSILQVALKCSDLDITDHLRQFLTLGAKASSWCGKHLQCSAKCIDQSHVLEEEDHNRLCQEVNSLSLSISTKLLDIAAKGITVPGLEVAEGEEGQGAAQEECVLNKADDAFPTLVTMAMGMNPDPEVSQRCTHCVSEKTSRWRPGPDGPGTMCNACWQKGNPRHHWGHPSIKSRRCMHCSSEKTPRWLRGPDGPATLCSACGQRFLKGRLLQSNPIHRRGRRLIKGRRCMHCASEKTPTRCPGLDGPAMLRNACGKRRFMKGRLLHSNPRHQGRPSNNPQQCMHCGSESTIRWLRGPDGPATLCNACGQRFLKGRLHSNSPRGRGRSSKKRLSSSKDDLAAGNDVVGLAEAQPCGVGASLDAFFDDMVTGPEVPCGEAGAERADDEEELEWLSNKDAFPSVETMAVELEEEASAPDVPRARAKGRRRVTAMETTRRQANVRAQKDTVRRCTHCATEKTSAWRHGPEGPSTLCNACGAVFRRKGLPSSPPAAKETVRRCTRCAREKTPQWREGPEGPLTLCNACGLAFRKTRRLLPENRPANSPALSPSGGESRALKMLCRNETSATGEMQVVLMDPPANGPTSSPLERTTSLCRLNKEEISAADHVAAAQARRGEESMEVQLLPERPPVDNPAFSLVSRSPVLKRRRKSEAATFAAIRATAKAGRADRAAARLAAMDN